MSSQLFAALFLFAVVAGLAIELWLIQRQIRHVGAHRAQVPAAFARDIEHSAHQRAADYTRARMRLARPDLVAGSAFLLALTFGGLLQAVHDLAGQVFEPGAIAHGVLFLGLLGALGWLVKLPFRLIRTFGIEARFGFNRMTPGLFIADAAKGALLTLLIGAPLLAGVLWLVGAMGERWWFWVWLAWMGFNALAMLIWPMFIAPLFNRFEPLADEALKARVEHLLSRCGFTASGLFVMDGSRRSAHGNAYFTGFGRAKRIVFFDTLLERLAPEEVEAVLAHELGHFHHRHIVKRIVLMAGLSFALMALLGELATQSWFYRGLGMQVQNTATALALFPLAVPVFMLPLTPLMSLWSRRHEYEADRYAARQANPDALISALVKLYRDNASTLTPDPWYSRFHDSHPPAAARIGELQRLAEGRAAT